jgi:hypothetical protein
MTKAPEDDSPDLTDEEIARALPTGGPDDLVPHLTGQKCECGQPMTVVKHEKRFRSPHLYWKAHLTCLEGHASHKVFQVTWLRGN